MAGFHFRGKSSRVKHYTFSEGRPETAEAAVSATTRRKKVNRHERAGRNDEPREHINRKRFTPA
jgi:hypothetical protein